MTRGGLVLALGVLMALLALSAGCASVAPVVSATGASGLPDWILVVPPPDGERAFYVGACAAAPDTAAGVSEAESDARAQARSAARTRIVPLVDGALHDAGVQTTGLERAGFRSLVTDPVVERLVGTLRRERVFYRKCAAPPAAGSPEGVCDVFVLMTADLAVWERLPFEFMADLRKQRQAVAGDSASVELLDWILRHHDDVDAGSGGGANLERP